MKKLFTALFLVLMVYEAASGQSMTRFSLTTNRTIGESLSFSVNYGASISVDWGDGVASTYTSNGDSIKGVLKGGTVVVSGYDMNVLDCSNQSLTAINVTELTDLRTLTCQGNLLAVIDISKNLKLQKLNCAYNGLTALNTTTNVALTELIANNNSITALNVSANKLLNTLICNHNQLKTLSVTALVNLKTLWCHHNQLSALDASKNTLLETLLCYNNLIASLNVSGLTALQQLWCDGNKIADLNASSTTALKYLSANNNLVSKYSVASPNALKALYIQDNALGYSLLPSPSSITNYAYAPQALLTIPATSTNSVNLSAQLFSQNNVATNAVFKWYNGATQLVSPDDYVENAGVFTFKKSFDAAYCEISSALFPDLQKITSTTTAISVSAGFESAQVANSLNIQVRNGKLFIRSLIAQPIRVYSLTGVLVKSLDRFVGETEFSLAKGAYLLNGTKVVL